MLGMFGKLAVKKAKEVFAELADIEEQERIDAINEIRMELKKYSPLNAEPVDCVIWARADDVTANDYNPNAVAPPEMKLLELSIKEDGYTQPIVAWRNGDGFEVVDGFHRNRVGKESTRVRDRIKGRLPLSIINKERQDRSDRIAATIRHNRARGKHKVEAMSDIVLELKRRNWKDERIARELGMDQDEILRLCQITGLSEMFSDEAFSKSWDVEDSEYDDFTPLDDSDGIETEEDYRHLNTDDADRIFHTYDKWECARAGFYRNTFEGKTADECERAYAEFLSNSRRFGKALKGVVFEWKHSCEHYLTNRAMNRIAWLGQAAMCYATGIPAAFRGGWNRLSKEEQDRADKLALKYLNKWLKANGRKAVTMGEAQNEQKQTTIY